MEAGANQRATPAETSSLWPLALLVALGTVLRIIGLNQQLWFDEMDTLLNSVRRPLVEILTTYPSQNQHTLYSVLAWFPVHWFGESPWALRLPAMLFGVASIPAVYALGRLIATRREALVAAGLMAVSYHPIWFSQNARGYTGMLFFTLITTSWFLCGMREQAWRPWILYAVGMALGMYTHLTMGFVAAAHGLVFLVVIVTRRVANAWPEFTLRGFAGFILAGLLSIALYAPVLPEIFARTVVEAAPKAVQWEWKSPLWALQEAIRGLSFGSGAGLAAVLVAGIIALSGLVSYWRQERVVVGLMILPGVVTAAAMLAVGHNLWPRFFFFAVGFAFLLLVRGGFVLTEVTARRVLHNEPLGARVGGALAVLMVLVSAATVPAAYRLPKQDFAGAMRYVDENRGASYVVVTFGLTNLPYRDFYRREYRSIKGLAELNAIRSEGHPVWILYAFPIHAQAEYPDLWDTIQREFQTVRVFPGTLGGGEVYVARWYPAG